MEGDGVKWKVGVELTFDFVFADVDEGWWIDRCGGEVEDHLSGRCE
jgi:hypothetical protein